MLEKQTPISPLELRYWLTLDENTGELFWKTSPTPRIKVGDKAGYRGAKGYYRVKLKRELYLLHRVVWALATGDWPKSCLDHIDGNVGNNALANLREATQVENRRNSSRKGGSSKFTGVTWHKTAKKWVARFRQTDNYKYLGLFEDEIEAAKAYNVFARKFYGEFARLNDV